MKEKINTSRPILRRGLSLLMALSMVLSLGASPVSVLSAEAVKKDEVQTGVVQIGFDTAADAEKFDLYHSSSGGFAVQDGKLTPTGTAGEFKAIYKSTGKKIKSVSVELHPVGSNGPIFGGLYLNASDIADGQDRVNGLYVGVEAHHTGWADAPNRIDLVTGSFPAWKELGRIISETGAGNNLFSGGVKEPLLLKVDIHGNQLTSTVSLVRDPSKKITSTYVYQGAGDLSAGSVGIRSQFNNACYDNFLVEYEEAEPQRDTVTLTDTVDFETDAESFDLYTSSGGGFAVQDGKLTPSGAGGEFKAIYKKPEGAKIRQITVDIYPGASGTLMGGLYLSAKDPGNPVEQIDALNINVDSNHSGWSDAPNRIDLVVGSFPRWTELYRLICETGAGNNLFSGGVKEALKLNVVIDGNRLDVTLSLLRDPGKSVSFSYVYQGAGDLSAGDVGIRSPFHDAAYDNFTVQYTVEEIPEEPTTEEPTTEEPTTEEPTTEEPTTEEPTTEEPTTEEPTEPDVSLEPTDLVDFENADSNGKFDFYHSSSGGFAVQDGKLVPVGDAGEFKAIYKDTNASFRFVSVDIYPGEKGINGGLYLDVTSADHPIDQANALYVGIESDFPHGNEPFWPDAPNRLDLVVGKFPQWQELHRAVSETGAGNNLFTGGVKEPVNLSVAINGNELTITVRLISDPARYVTTTYIYAEGQDISLGNVGIRSAHCDAAYDNFAVIYEQVEQDKDPDDIIPEEPTTEPATEPEEPTVPTDVVDFESADSNGKFSFYHSSNGGFAVQDGKLVPAGDAGEFKAIYKDTNASFQFVSVDIYPGEKGINGGLYVDATDADHPIDQVNSLYIGIESDFPHDGEPAWEDAPNRLDLVIGKFPQWAELHRVVSETGVGNNLFSGGVKEPVNLSVAMDGNELTVTVSLLRDPSRSISTVYTYEAGQDMSLGNVGIRSNHSDAAYDNFAVIYTQAEQDKEDDTLPEEPTTEPTEPVTRPEPTDLVDFENTDSSGKFSFYHSSNGGFAVQDGKLVPAGDAGEFKAIYKDTNASFQFVSVDIYPGQDGIRGGLYLDVTDVDHPVDQANALYVGIESDFPHGEEPAWEDAPNRLDLVIGKFPQWVELHRVVSETGAGNSLFTGGVKEPVNLSVAMDGNELTVTVSLLSDPSRSVTTTYVFADGQDMSLGNVGIRSYFCDAAYDNFAVVYEQAEQDKEDDTLPEEPTTEPTEPVTRPEPTDVVDFDDALSREQFHFYHSSNGGFAVEDGKLVPAGEAGEFKAIYKDTNANFSYVSVDIYPGQDGIRGGLYLDVTDVGHGQDQITGLYVGIESDFPHGEEPAWEDAPNRLDLVIGKFPQWAELHRAVSETGAGNNLFTGGVKEPINLSVAVHGKKLTVTVSLLSDPSRYLTTTYVCADAKDLGLGNVGIRSQYCDAAYDNFFVAYEQVQEDKEQDILIPELQPTDVVDFGKKDDAQKFDFYHSSQGGFAVRDGKLMPVGEEGEFKAIYRDGGSTIQAVSVDIYPGESGQINSGIYIGTSTVEDGVDRIKGLVVMVESSFSGWDDAVNRIDLVVGRFPIWKELHRCTSETGNGNALFAGAKEPLNLSVFLDGNTLTVKLSLISNPEKFVTTTYTYNGATELPTHNVGLRSAFNDAAFDNFAVRTLEGGGSNDPEAPGSDGGNGTATGGTGMTPDTGDAFRPELSLTLMLLSIAAIVALVWKKNKFISQEVSQ